ncbi:EamA family transporter [Nocardioides pocheonensis]|uniref:EamA family transporter n=1 Tax=Nocardioides pocheonensis TaxID=661485 RepID=A0A3N0GH50_9ACTN|nr:EamA family transporter [Nocardioides pocheonensis]RNM11488.1 EamA family transporter [Nocardioides pocheonensis]
MDLRHALLATLVAVIWGFNFVVIEWGMTGVPPLLFVALRFTAVVVPAVFLVPRPAVSWRVVAAVGTFMSLGQFGLLYTSMHLGMPPGLAALVLQAQVLFTVLIAAVWLRERPTGRQVGGILLASAGLVVVGAGRGGHVPLGALGLCVAAALSWGIGNVVARRAAVPSSSGLSLVVWSSLVVPVPLFVLSLALDGPSTVGHALAHLGPEAIASTAYTAVLASLVGYSIFNGLLARYPASTVVPFVLIAPPVAMASGWLLLGQAVNPAEGVGGLVVLAGVLVTVWRRSSGLARDDAQGTGRAAADPPYVDEAGLLELRGEPVAVAVGHAPAVEDHAED